ncbi:hypothetical protein B0A49_02437 [Cryomyces minteri]|uniref:Uncharacterized protein n=1 Tax=Cryomyces minteri TaxID=331657 RepID=A0A4U0XNN6_9PEZI|nr:hypothetical protein B0A49_02437 [Cryomyces minteri]
MTRGAKDPTGVFNDAVLGGYDSGSNTVCVGSRGAAITAAAFMSGHKTRAVTVGADGRCRLVDFESGGKILRTWHVRGPATSLSILSLKSNPSLASTTKGPSGPKKGLKDGRNTTNMHKPTTTDNVLAVGRVDGKVLLFDSVGLLLAEQVVDQSAGRVIDVDWMEGPAPKPVHSRGSETAPLVKDTVVDLPALSASNAGSRGNKSGKRSRRESIPNDSKRSSLASHSSPDGPTKHVTVLSPGSTKPARHVPWSKDGSVAMSGALPDESGTVHRTPISGPIYRDLPAVPAAMIGYMDLFSPVKPIFDIQKHGLEPYSDFSKETVVEPFKESRSLSHSNSLATNSTSCSSISNGKILADLRRVDNDGQKSRKGSLAFFAPYMKPKAAPSSNLNDCPAQKRAMKELKKEYKAEVESQAQKHDTADELEDEWEDDIWLTSDTEAQRFAFIDNSNSNSLQLLLRLLNLPLNYPPLIFLPIPFSLNSRPNINLHAQFPNHLLHRRSLHKHGTPSRQ